ncbi:MAG TPA: hypothetical protein P5186_16795 [Candidatus Paceibacterota bacterium]|nr:hypothetical protein [Candidatus Paceibacterota bacterium]
MALLTLGCHVIRCGPLADGFEPIFDGCTLNGWQGQDMSFWSVEDEAITGTISPEHAPKLNQYLVWQGERTVFDREGAKHTERLEMEAGAEDFRLDEWHEYHLVAQGRNLSLRVNGKLIAEASLAWQFGERLIAHQPPLKAVGKVAAKLPATGVWARGLARSSPHSKALTSTLSVT